MARARNSLIPTYPFDSKPIQKDIGGRIREARIAAGITQSALAQRIGVEASAVSQYESGDIDVSLSRLAHIAHALDVMLDVLMFPRAENEDARVEQLIEKTTKGALKQIFQMAEAIETGSPYGTKVWHIPEWRLEGWGSGKSFAMLKMVQTELSRLSDDSDDSQEEK